jgi:hypothetical protein
MAVFDENADATLDEVRGIYAQRGGEYADSWALSNQHAPFLRMVVRELFGGVELNPDQVRLLVAAAMVDIKDSRMGGPYKRDSVIDGIAYRALFAGLMEEYLCNNPSTSSKSPPASEPTILSDHPSQTEVSRMILRQQVTGLV